MLWLRAGTPLILSYKSTFISFSTIFSIFKEQNYFLLPYKKTPHNRFFKFFLYQLNIISLSYFFFSLSYFISFFFSSLFLSLSSSPETSPNPSSIASASLTLHGHLNPLPKTSIFNHSNLNSLPFTGPHKGRRRDFRRAVKDGAHRKSKKLAESCCYRLRRNPKSHNQVNNFTDDELQQIGLGHTALGRRSRS